MSILRYSYTLLLLAFPLFMMGQSNAAASLGKWQSLKSTDGTEPVERHEAAFVRVGKRFYLLGGRGIRPVSIYDPKAGTWTEGKKPPIEIHHFQPVVFNKKIYIIGALTGKYPGETPIPKVMIYDPATDAWSEGATIPEGRRRGGAGATLYKNKIYIACGIKDGHRGDHKKWLDVYDPRTNQWTQLADAPRARDHFQAVALKGKIYLLGGRRSQAGGDVFANGEPTVDVFDLRTGTWSTLPNPLPTTRAGNFTALIPGKRIVVLGGESSALKTAHPEMEVLNTKDASWETWSPLIQGRHGTGAILYKNKLYVASGCGNRGGSPELKTMEVFGLR